jgi:hypothetical protein
VALVRVDHDAGDEEAHEVSAHAAQHAQLRRLLRVVLGGDLAPVDLALEERPPLLLVVAPDQLHPGQPAAPEPLHQLPLVVAANAALGLHVIDGRRGRPGDPGREHFDGDRGR